MGWTKRDLIDGAFAELALGSEAWDVTAGEQTLALRRMDAMLADWEQRGIRLGYPIPDGPKADDLDADSGVPSSAVQAIQTGLAVRMAPTLGKQVHPSTQATARDSFQWLLKAAAMPQEQQLPSTMPRGAGNRVWRNTQRPFFPKPDTGPLDIAAGGDLRIKE